jgi:DNA-binding MarR family transcriptional regulator
MTIERRWSEGTCVGKKLPLGVEVQKSINLDRFLPYRIHRLWARTSSPRITTLRSGAAIRVREWRVLLVLAAFGPLTNSEIAESVSMDTGTTTRAVKDLLKAGLVAVRTHTSDRRRRVVTLTPAGAAAHDEVAPLRAAFSDRLLDGLSPPEQDILFALIAKLEAQAEAIAPAGDDREDHWEAA